MTTPADELLSNLRVSAIVLEQLPDYNGAIKKIDDVEAEKIARHLDDAVTEITKLRADNLKFEAACAFHGGAMERMYAERDQARELLDAAIDLQNKHYTQIKEARAREAKLRDALQLFRMAGKASNEQTNGEAGLWMDAWLTCDKALADTATPQ